MVKAWSPKGYKVICETGFVENRYQEDVLKAIVGLAYANEMLKPTSLQIDSTRDLALHPGYPGSCREPTQGQNWP